MSCPYAAEIKEELLSTRCRSLLQKFIDRWKSDSSCPVYHHDSITLALRQELGYSAPMVDCHCGYHYIRLADCCIADTLEDAMEERVIEQELPIL